MRLLALNGREVEVSIRRQRIGLLRLDANEIGLLAAQRGWTKTRLAEKAELSRNTLVRVDRGEGIFPQSAKRLAEALGATVDQLLLRDGNSVNGSRGSFALPNTEEWRVVEYRSAWCSASNGLQYRICRMEHLFTRGREGRGKFYDLLRVPDHERAALREHLNRHSDVCHRIGRHPHIAENESCVPTQGREGWWVIDRWVNGVSLENRLCEGSCPQFDVPRLMEQIASGLDALHAAGIVFRELAPHRVLIRESDGCSILTEFELAKLLEKVPTVSADWPEDSYRAPEVESGRVTPAADIYSWARILVRVACNVMPNVGDDVEALKNTDLPKPVTRVLAKCLSPCPSDRPQKITDLCRVLRGWLPSA